MVDILQVLHRSPGTVQDLNHSKISHSLFEDNPCGYIETEALQKHTTLVITTTSNEPVFAYCCTSMSSSCSWNVTLLFWSRPFHLEQINTCYIKTNKSLKNHKKEKYLMKYYYTLQVKDMEIIETCSM